MSEQTMIERMAWAIASTEYPTARGNDFWKDDIHKFSEVVERAFIAEARAALEAMKEPGPDLEAVGARSINDSMDDVSFAARARQCWQAMIQAALGDK